MARTERILVLGNGPQINDIDFESLDPKIKTFGVNRIWLLHCPDYFFFQDHPIIREIEANPAHKAKLIDKSECFSSDWLRRNYKSVPNWITTHDRSDRTSFPDSVSSGLKMLVDIYKIDKSRTVFYIAGVNLRWMEPSHFWKDLNYPASNKYGKGWYDSRFNKIFNNFKGLQSLGFNMISVTPNSLLNKIMRYENIENLYIK